MSMRRTVVLLVVVGAAFLLGRWSGSGGQLGLTASQFIEPVLAGVIGGPAEDEAEGGGASQDGAELETRTVTRVIDGDTVVLDGGERVRLIGVDTPETVHPNKPVEFFGKEASAFTRRTVEGRKVRPSVDTQKRS